MTDEQPEKIGGYTVIDALKGGGKSRCVKAFAPDRQIVFLKRFLAPLYPVDPGSDPVRAAKLRAAGDAFARRHLEIMEPLSSTIHGGGNLVKPIAFFREGGAYYKAYPYLEADPSTDMATASPSDKLIFLKTLILSVRELHTVGVVHADLKPDNVLIKRRPAGTVTKLIDFDEAYVSGSPPSVRAISGDPVYFSPELERYSEGDARPIELTLASDIFSFGLLVHRVLTGALPKVEGGSGDSCGRRVQSGGTLTFDRMPYLPAAFEKLLPHTVALNPEHRPSIDHLAEAVGLPHLGEKKTVTAPSPQPGGDATAAKSHETQRVVSNMGRRRNVTHTT